ncbi:F-box domain-containing protein [Heracleum sosnowskyi]|uniref:F-box domain-containing protein n=1 Tax=Heracleum sosnowskyi TaxID=360622 RepID=A0AAD8MCX6_9APIA|nr:F-box domain-containing protein [Heracleum sosnowskyi]
MRKRRHTAVSLIELLPEDLLIQIFLKLPVKYVYSCKRVCKHFLYIIEEPKYSVCTHKSLVLLHSGCKSEHGWPYYQNTFFMLLMDEITKEVVACLRLYPPFRNCPGLYHPTVIGSSNGLICYAAWLGYNYDIDFANFMLLLWNPVTNQSRYVPRHQSKCKPDVIEFGYIEETNDYVIVKVGSPGFNLEVYNMSTDSWRTIDSNLFSRADSIPTVYRDQNAVFVNGSFHWAIKNSNSNNVVYYNVKEEKLGLINMLDSDNGLNDKRRGFYRRKLDKWRGFNRRKLLVVEEKLAMIYWNRKKGNRFEIWVMNDCGIGNSWTRHFQISETFTDCMGYWANGLILLNEEEVLFFYDLKTRSRKKMSLRDTTGWRHRRINGFSSFVTTRVPVSKYR